MTVEKMTLTRALAEAKAIDGKLDRVLQTSVFVTIAQGQAERRKTANPQLAGKTVAETEASIKSNFQSAGDLIKRYQAIKKAIIKTNAETTVTISGTVMTIAEAIERKSSINLEKKFLVALRQQQVANTQAVDQLNNRLNDTIEKGVTQLYGSDRAKITDEQIKVVNDAKKQDFEPTLIDPIGISAVIENMLNQIEKFDLEVNFSLSEINAKTEIEVQY